MNTDRPPRSPRILRINAGSCNGCDVELAATAGVSRFDVTQLGCSYCESPEEADLVLVTGPLTERMKERVLATFAEVPDPKVTVAVGICPISGGVFRESYAVAGPLDRHLSIDVNVPGCPPRPQAILVGIAEGLRIWQGKAGAPSDVPAPTFEGETPAGFRGRIRFDPAACAGCRLCTHVCAGDAIRFDDDPDGLHFTLWHNSCAACALCAHYCPTGAITSSGEWRLAHRQEEKFTLAERGKVPCAPCAECGVPLLPVPPELMRRSFRAVGEEIERLRTVCPECRLTLNLGGKRR